MRAIFCLCVCCVVVWNSQFSPVKVSTELRNCWKKQVGLTLKCMGLAKQVKISRDKV